MKPAGFIDRNQAIPVGQDFALLRQQAMTHIQTLCGHLWTDHNLHDPGITSMEALIFALIDLSYRTSLPSQDLLAREDGGTDPSVVSGFFPPEEMLPAGPVTIFDLRRLLLKIKGIRNAWCVPLIDQSADVPLYYDHATIELGYSGDPTTERYDQVYISGLYRILLELEIDDELGNLNEFRVRDRVLDHPALQGALVDVTAESESISQLQEDPAGDFQEVDELTTVSLQADGTFKTGAVLKLEGGQVDIGQIRIRVRESTDNVTQNQIRSWLLSAATPLAKLWKKYQRIHQLVAKARCALAANRGLTEDFIAAGPIVADKLGICADIDVDPSADLEAIKAEVIQRIDEYVNPPAEFSSLSELLSNGESVEQIFNGPFVDWSLKCDGQAVFEQVGFVDQTSLAASELKDTVYTSDLIEVLVGIEGIRSVRNVALRKPGLDARGNEQTDRWCMPVKPYHQPRLDPNESRFRFYKDGVPFRIRTEEFELSLAQLRSLARRSRLVVGDDFITQQQGKFRDPSAFYSVQNDFPLVYGIGTAGLPTGASEQRLAQARQFKGYLAVFDQLLADYLAQLSHARDLLSLRDDLEQTYYAGSLESVPGVRDAFATEIFSDPPKMLDTNRRNEMAEDDVRFTARRNQALDHLIARFAESFTDYVFLTYNLDGDRLHSDQTLIRKKIDFAREIPTISRRRGLGFNYAHGDTWDTENVSGLEQRVSRLLGIDSFSRRNLSCEALLEQLFRPRHEAGKFRLEVKTSDNRVLFSSEKKFDSEQEMRKNASIYYDRLNEASTFKVEKIGDDSWTYSILSPKRDDQLRNRQRYASRQEAVEESHAVLHRHNELLSSDDICSNEGFHLIEHVLLRPRRTGDPLMEPCMADPDNACGDQDPYSHRISVLCPAWPQRFRSMEFRRFFERAVRSETPAHIHARICWISNQDMRRLDKIYREWLAALQRSLASERTRRRRLIEFLASAESVYPAAELHDCEDDTDTSVPVRLDETKLGLF